MEVPVPDPHISGFDVFGDVPGSSVNDSLIRFRVECILSLSLWRFSEVFSLEAMALGLFWKPGARIT